MNGWIARNWLKFACALLIAIGLVLIASSIISNQQAVNQTATDTTPSSESSSQNGGSDAAGEDLEESEGEENLNNQSCDVLLTTEDYQAFVNLVMDYEEGFQAAPSPEKLEKLAPLTTNQYKADHGSTGDGSSTTVTVLRDKTVVTCSVSADGSRLAGTEVHIQTSFINDSGEVEIIYPEIKLPEIHYSKWVLENGQWKVLEEY